MSEEPADTRSASPPREVGRSSLRVAVLVDLLYRPDAGGHVKAWERLATSAIGVDDLVLTVHFSGEREAARQIGANVRLRVHPPVLSTARLPFLSHVPDHTDLAPHHPGLARELTDVDLIHTTDAYFAFARTAERVSRRRRVPLTTSIHTDTPSYTRIFAAQTITRLLGRGPVGRLVDERLGLPRLAEARMRQRLLEHQRACAATFVSRAEDAESLREALAPRQVAVLRRGVDRDLFSPERRDRRWLEQRFTIPEGRRVVLYVGRVNHGKNVLTLVDAIAALIDDGRPVHLICAGEGDDRTTVTSRLGVAASCPGALPPEELARIYASVDLVAHPSEIEERSNVALEAHASGRPLVASEAVGRGLVVEGATGILVRGAGPQPWREALGRLIDDGGFCELMGAAARKHAETTLPSWRDVLVEDLLPTWRRAGAAAPAGV